MNRDKRKIALDKGREADKKVAQDKETGAGIRWDKIKEKGESRQKKRGKIRERNRSRDRCHSTKEQGLERGGRRKKDQRLGNEINKQG